MATPFDRVLTGAGVLGADGKVSEAEKQKFADSVGNFLKNGSQIPGLEFPPDPNAEETIKRLKESKSWNKTYVEGLLEPTVKMMDTTGNIPLFPIHDPSSTFGFDIDVKDLGDPTKFTPDVILTKTSLTLSDVTAKLAEIPTNIPAIPPVPQLPPAPTPDVMLENFDIKKEDLSLSADGIDVDLAGKKTIEITSSPIDLFTELLKAPLDIFSNLLANLDGTLESIIDGTLPQKILKLITDLIKIIMEKIGAIISTAIALVSTILAWAYKVVSAIAASIVSAIVGTGSISTSVYNARLS
jgi:hypothetical protein